MLHHKTYFPILVGVLTLILAGAIFSIFKDRATLEPTVPSAVTSVEYQANAHAILGDVRTRIAAESASEGKSEILSKAREALLQLHVPSEYKDLHLDLVILLTDWMNGTEGAEARWQTLVDQYSWIE